MLRKRCPCSRTSACTASAAPWPVVRRWSRLALHTTWIRTSSSSSCAPIWRACKIQTWIKSRRYAGFWRFRRSMYGFHSSITAAANGRGLRAAVRLRCGYRYRSRIFAGLAAAKWSHSNGHRGRHPCRSACQCAEVRRRLRLGGARSVRASTL